MQDKLLDKRLRNKIMYTICFFLFVVIDQRVKTLPSREGWLFTWQNALGIVVALLIMTHYKWENIEKYKLLYILWSIFGTVGGMAYYIWKSKQAVFFANANIVLILAVFLFGYIAIYTCTELFVKKEKICVKKSFLCVWIAMMLLMVFSRSEYLWPMGYMIIFGAFYFTNFSKEEIHDMVLCGCNGIILAFFVIQGLAFVFRPYEMVYVRYLGMYTNPNQNSLFYLCILVALLVKLIYYKKQENKVGYFFHLFLIMAVFGFLFLALGRTAIIVALLLVLLSFKIVFGKIFKKQTIKQLVLLMAGMVVALPLCFAATRYLPAMFHHPIWFDGEWREYKVHSWDPWDSEKYVTFDAYNEYAFGRVWETITSVLDNSPFKLDVNASEQAVPEKESAILSAEEAQNSILVRKTIYENYIKKLNWSGQPYREQGIQLTEKIFTYHAHNFYLQYGTDFGIPVMVLLIILVIWSCCIYGKRIYKESNIEDIAMLMFILVPALYGILEYSWGVGSIGTTMLFLAWRIPEWKN